MHTQNILGLSTFRGKASHKNEHIRLDKEVFSGKAAAQYFLEASSENLTCGDWEGG